jgi:dipeptidyl aminopeptidase/acylaminoacyl peptidase
VQPVFWVFAFFTAFPVSRNCDLPYSPVMGWLRSRAGKLLTISVVIYCGLSLVGAGLFVEIAIHPKRQSLNSSSTFAQLVARDYHARLQDASITSQNGVRLNGWYIKPLKDNGSAIVLLHGVGDNRMGMSGYARLFLSSGYRVLLPDSRAHGESSGAFATFGLLERHDVHQWVNWLYSKDPPNCIFAFGESMGAAITLQALESESRFCAVAVESPFANLREIAYERLDQAVDLGPWFGRTIGRPVIEIAFLYARLRYHMDLRNSSPEKAVAASNTPVLLIHGDSDSNILPENSKRLHRAIKKSELWIVPGAGHGGAWAAQPTEFEQRIAGWFESHDQRPVSATH